MKVMGITSRLLGDERATKIEGFSKDGRMGIKGIKYSLELARARCAGALRQCGCPSIGISSCTNLRKFRNNTWSASRLVYATLRTVHMREVWRHRLRRQIWRRAI